METTEKQRALEALRALPEHATIEDAIDDKPYEGPPEST